MTLNLIRSLLSFFQSKANELDPMKEMNAIIANRLIDCFEIDN